jgi:hypothetical protein
MIVLDIKGRTDYAYRFYEGEDAFYGVRIQWRGLVKFLWQILNWEIRVKSVVRGKR